MLKKLEKGKGSSWACTPGLIKRKAHGCLGLVAQTCTLVCLFLTQADHMLLQITHHLL